MDLPGQGARAVEIMFCFASPKKPLLTFLRIIGIFLRGYVDWAILWTGGFFTCEFRRFLVEDEFRFVLAPAYSLFVGAAVKKQSGEKIRFVVEDIDDEALKDSLRRAFKNHLDYLHESSGRAEKSAGRPEVSFVAGNRRKIRRYILKKHGEPWKLRVV